MIARLGAVAFLVITLGCGRAADKRSGGAQPAAPTTSPATSPAASAAPGDERLRIAVDRRVELLSILSRLAGDPSYGRATGVYAEDVDKHFGPLRQHAAVTATAELRAKHGVSYDGPMRIAVYADEALRPRRTLEPPPPGLDDARFRGVDVAAHLATVAAFAQASGFDGFFRAHAGYYAGVEGTFREFLRGKAIIPWFDALLGPKPGADYHLAPSPLTWPMSYGVRAVVDGAREEVLEAMFLERPDARGGFEPGEISLELCVHELAHSYLNPIVDAAMKELEPAAAPVFRRVEKAMRASAYGTPTIMTEEAVVRAVALAYLRERSTRGHAERCLAEQRRLGFAWTDELTNAIDALRRRKPGPIAAADLVAAVRAVLVAWSDAQPKD